MDRPFVHSIYRQSMPHSTDHFCIKRPVRRRGNAVTTIGLHTDAKRSPIPTDAIKWFSIRVAINWWIKLCRQPPLSHCISRKRSISCTLHWTRYQPNCTRRCTSSMCRRPTVWWKSCRCCRAPKRRASLKCGNRISMRNRRFSQWNIWSTPNRCTSERIGRWSVCRRSIAVVIDRKPVAWMQWIHTVAGMNWIRRAHHRQVAIHSRDVSWPLCLQCLWQHLWFIIFVSFLCRSTDWLQNATDCPLLTAPVDGGWSAWSDWFNCSQHSDDDQSTETGNHDRCLCRTRVCNNPSPRNGGFVCQGMSTGVTNCTVNGGWTEWSPWSACSNTCGIAVKTRRRTCGNPKPAHGGRTCVGKEHDEMYCQVSSINRILISKIENYVFLQHLPPCPEIKLPPIDGNWGIWSPWKECSAPCGGGFRFRQRQCNDPAPQHGGMQCIGCDMDFEECNKHACPEIKKMTPWTPWLTNGTTTDGNYLEKRFRFSCRANAPDPGNVKVSLTKEETRVCHVDGSCQRTGDGNDESGWSDWSTWSACSAECGAGQQFRTRSCEKGNCPGTDKMARACNTHPCRGNRNFITFVRTYFSDFCYLCVGEWGCWSEWSPCSVSCGVGQRTRTRNCLAMTNDLYEKNCEGNDYESIACELPSCDCKFESNSRLCAESIYSNIFPFLCVNSILGLEFVGQLVGM